MSTISSASTMPYNVINTNSVLASKISNNNGTLTMPYNVIDSKSISASEINKSTIPYNVINTNSVLASEISKSTMPYNVINPNSVLSSEISNNYSKLSSIQTIHNNTKNSTNKSFYDNLIKHDDIKIVDCKIFIDFYTNLYKLVLNKTYFDLIMTNNIIAKLSYGEIKIPRQLTTKYDCNNCRLLYECYFFGRGVDYRLIEFYNSINKPEINNILQFKNDMIHDSFRCFVHKIIDKSYTRDEYYYFYEVESLSSGWSFVIQFSYDKLRMWCGYFKIIVIYEK